VVAPPQAIDASVSTSGQSLRALDTANVFIGGVLAGFGAFVALFLGDQGWSPADIGFVLSAGGVAGLLAQLPGGELLDVVRSKRFLLGSGIIIVGFSALIIGLSPTFPVVFLALVLQGITGGFLGPAIPAVSLGLVGHSALAERLGRNQRYLSTGGLVAAGLMGVVGYLLSNRSIFFVTAMLAVPALAAVIQIRAAEIHFGRACCAPDDHEATAPTRVRRATLGKNRHLLIFAACLFLFQMANASILPLIGGVLAHHEGRQASLTMAILVIVPQVLVALLAPWAGRQAESWGRRPLLLVGFGVLPIRALLFTVVTDPAALIAVQVLDGISGTMLGVLQPLIIADLTRGTGRYNLGQGFAGVISGVGASLSTTLSGLIAANLGQGAGFLAVAATALGALAVLWASMPETKPAPVESRR
jgi:MFS family permease